MRYESAKTHHGNVGVSYESQERANAQAAGMDERNCHDCYGCTDCTDCTDCSDCSGCTDCYGCTDCTDCTDCSDCSGCTDCTDCSNCTYCTDCTDCSDCSNCTYCTDCYGCTDCTDCTDCSDCTYCTGAFNWTKCKAKNLFSLSGLKWPVATDGQRIQIGCKNYTVEEWGAFTDAKICKMADGASDFWAAHKATIMALAKCRAALDETS